MTDTGACQQCNERRRCEVACPLRYRHGQVVHIGFDVHPAENRAREGTEGNGRHLAQRAADDDDGDD